MLTIYITSILLYSFSLTTFTVYSSFLIFVSDMFYFVDFANCVFNGLFHFLKYCCVLQNINRLFSFSSFNTKGSSLQVSIFFLTAAFWFTLNLAVLVNIVLLYSPLSSEFGLISFLNLSLFDCLTFLLFDFRVFFFVCILLYLSLAYVI